VSLFKRGEFGVVFYRDGVRHQYSTGTPNRRQAETIEASSRRTSTNNDSRLPATDPNTTFGELAERFTEAFRTARTTDTT